MWLSWVIDEQANVDCALQGLVPYMGGEIALDIWLSPCRRRGRQMSHFGFFFFFKSGKIPRLQSGFADEFWVRRHQLLTSLHRVDGGRTVQRREVYGGFDQSPDRSPIRHSRARWRIRYDHLQNTFQIKTHQSFMWIENLIKRFILKTPKRKKKEANEMGRQLATHWRARSARPIYFRRKHQRSKPPVHLHRQVNSIVHGTLSRIFQGALHKKVQVKENVDYQIKTSPNSISISFREPEKETKWNNAHRFKRRKQIIHATFFFFFLVELFISLSKFAKIDWRID